MIENVKEITITVKGKESIYQQKFQEKRDFQIHEDDPVIKEIVALAESNSNIMPEEIKVRVLLVL